MSIIPPRAAIADPVAFPRREPPCQVPERTTKLEIPRSSIGRFPIPGRKRVALDVASAAQFHDSISGQPTPGAAGRVVPRPTDSFCRRSTIPRAVSRELLQPRPRSLHQKTRCEQLPQLGMHILPSRLPLWCRRFFPCLAYFHERLQQGTDEMSHFPGRNGQTQATGTQAIAKLRFAVR